MSTTINTASATLSNALFDKLDTKQKGYIDQADLQAAAGPDGDSSKTAEVFKTLDSDGDGKVTKSELSTAMDKVSDSLNAQLDASRVTAASAHLQEGGAAGKGGGVHGGHGGGGGGGGGGEKSGGTSDSGSTTSSSSDTKYVAAADTNGDGTVSDTEEAAYELQQAAAKAQAQVEQYKAVGNDSSADKQGAASEKSGSAIDVSA
jgi:hypothetical protein